MFISDINSKSSMVKTGLIYLFVSVFCLLFGIVYEFFSHGVYSNFMMYAFLFPLIGGTLLFWGMNFLRMSMPGRVSGNLYHFGIATLTIGCLFEGALEIYGTTNRLVSVYWILGSLFFLTSILIYIYGLSRVKKSTMKKDNFAYEESCQC